MFLHSLCSVEHCGFTNSLPAECGWDESEKWKSWSGSGAAYSVCDWESNLLSQSLYKINNNSATSVHALQQAQKPFFLFFLFFMKVSRWFLFVIMHALCKFCFWKGNPYKCICKKFSRKNNCLFIASYSLRVLSKSWQ